MNQREFIYNYNNIHRPKFNDDLFVRTDDELLNAMRDVIYSCERNEAFIIKVLDFSVIDDYDEINRVLWEYEDFIINKGKRTTETTVTKKSPSINSKKTNQFAFINLKDSDFKLIKITYFIQITEKKDGLKNDTITVYIAVPRIVDDFYFRINGNYYSAMYQIVDASTYNNSAAKSTKKQSITFKTIFSPIRVYRYITNIKDDTGTQIPCTYFIGNMFKKSLLVMKYILAKFGFTGAMELLKIEGISILQSVDTVDRDIYRIFPVRDLFVVAPKVLYDSVQIVQSFVYTISNVITYMKDRPYEDFFNMDIWIEALGSEFANTDKEIMYKKGESIINSLEFIYDRVTMNDLKLPMEDKDSIYKIIRWIMYEFNALRQKDNLDISTKKVRWAEYIASLYASKLFAGICRISDKGDRAELLTVKQAINIPPMYLINAIIGAKCLLVNYKSCINDMDSILSLKYTYKGVSGIGAKSNAIGNSYRSIHPSHLGRVDINSSSNSDPGVSGTICPHAVFHDGHFDQYEEPNSWELELSKVIDAYRSMCSKVEVCRIIRDHGFREQKDNSVSNECISIGKSLISFPAKVQIESEYIPGYDIFGDGYFFVLNE